MTPVIKTGLLSALTAFGTAAMLTSASAAGFGELDANTDGQLDLAELQASFGENAEATLAAYDTDADSMISVEEAEAMAASSGAATTAEAPATGAEPAAEPAAPTDAAPAAPMPAEAAPAAPAEMAPGTEAAAAAEANAGAAAPLPAPVEEGAATPSTDTIDDQIRGSVDPAANTEAAN